MICWQVFWLTIIPEVLHISGKYTRNSFYKRLDGTFFFDYVTFIDKKMKIYSKLWKRRFHISDVKVGVYKWIHQGWLVLFTPVLLSEPFDFLFFLYFSDTLGKVDEIPLNAHRKSLFDLIRLGFIGRLHSWLGFLVVRYTRIPLHMILMDGSHGIILDIHRFLCVYPEL